MDLTTTVVTHDPVTMMISVWLQEAHGISESINTVKTYAGVVNKFRALLREAGHDLNMADMRVCDGDADLSEQRIAALALAAQAYSQSGQVKRATINLRLAALSTFYSYVIGHGLLRCLNPIDRIKRSKVQAYQGAHALRNEEVRELWQQIDRSTIDGKRDYAIIRMAILTGGRVSEIAGLRWGDVIFREEEIELRYDRLKGGNADNDIIPLRGSGLRLAEALREYLAALKAAMPSDAVVAYDEDAPFWVAFSNNGYHGALSVRALQRIAQKWIGTQKFHTFRHTSATVMRQVGDVQAVQRHLRHANIGTTVSYLATLEGHDHKFVDEFDTLIG